LTTHRQNGRRRFRKRQITNKERIIIWHQQQDVNKADTGASHAAAQIRPHAQTKTSRHVRKSTKLSSPLAKLKRRINNMSDKRQAIRDAEEEIEDIVEQLEREHGVRAFQIFINSNRGEIPQVNIVQDKRGGSL